MGLECGETPDRKIVERLAPRLSVAPSRAGNRGRMLPCGARKEERATANGETPGGAPPGFQGGPFVGRQRSNQKWCLHKDEDTT